MPPWKTHRDTDERYGISASCKITSSQRMLKYYLASSEVCESLDWNPDDIYSAQQVSIKKRN
jgi:hypothetical protein